MSLRRAALRPIAATACFAASCCVPAPTPTPSPVSTPAPASSPTPAPPPIVQQPVYDNWMDAPATPGDWEYDDRGNVSLAYFTGPGLGTAFAMHCFKSQRRVNLIVSGMGASDPLIRIRTETAERALNAELVVGEMPNVLANLQANDPLLDAMAFSRGRFAVETTGLPTLYLPAWPEITRVIEDCR